MWLLSSLKESTGRMADEENGGGWQGARSKCCQGEDGQVDTATIEKERGMCLAIFFFILCFGGTVKNWSKPVCADGYDLRKQFLLYLIKHRGNEVKDNFFLIL